MTTARATEIGITGIILTFLAVGMTSWLWLRWLL
jgi:hypothetical protein